MRNVTTIPNAALAPWTKVPGHAAATALRRGRRSEMRGGTLASAPFLVALGLLALTSCSGTTEPSSRAGIFSGPTVQIGGGAAHTVVTLGEEGNPISVAVAFSEGVVTNPPAPSGGMPSVENMLELPTETAGATVFNHASLDWNPQGHPPPMIYTVPHFDVHFYMISAAEREEITPADPDFAAKAARAPAPEFIPQGYISPDPMAIPRMGRHWIDPTSPEFNGAPFTATFIYGSYDGEMNFVEPMVSQAFLQTQPDFERELKLPARYARPGFYPTSYSVRYDASAHEYRVTLSDFVQRN